MTFIVEDGSGVQGANAYVTIAQVTDYLTTRNRGTQNSWDTIGATLQNAAIVEGTDYIESVFGDCFRGSKQWKSLNFARASLQFTAPPIAGETVTIGTHVYTFRASVSAADDVLIAANALSSLVNLGRAITAGAKEGVSYGTGTVAHADVGVLLLEPDKLSVIAKIEGLDGNEIVSTTTVTGATWNFATLQGGSTTGKPQPLSHPRVNLVDEDFILVVGIYDDLVSATCEYSIRSVSLDLDADPTVITTGSVTKIKEKVGPIEEETEFVPGSYGIIRPTPYPAADRLLKKYLRSKSGVIRG
jgi:hypothetical protein